MKFTFNLATCCLLGLIGFSSVHAQVPSVPSPAHLAMDVIQTADLSWLSGGAGGETISNEVYFGINPTPGPAEFQGTTLGTNWSLANLLPMTTYYWQVVARKTVAVTGPVWQFTTRGVDHFVWDSIPSPQYAGEPFEVSVTAKDQFETTVSNFTGTVNLSDRPGDIAVTNMILGNIAPNHAGFGQSLTLGYSFTPNTNLLVTHVRSFFGSKVSIWTDAGVLVTSQSVSHTTSAWIETPLATPVTLNANTTYRVAAYTGPELYFGKTVGSNQFPNGTINASCEASGDAFPAGSNGDSKRWFVDLRYLVGTRLFTNGIWNGNITAPVPATNVVLYANDGAGHVGQSAPFDVGLQNDIAVSVVASDPVVIGGNVTYFITITNIGPNPATGVFLSNQLPGTVARVSVTMSQGSSNSFGSPVLCDIGTIAGNASATGTLGGTVVSLGLRPGSARGAGAEGAPCVPNNTTDVTIPIQHPMISVSNVTLEEGNSGTRNALFVLSLWPPPALQVLATYSTADGAAIAPGDYTSTSGQIYFQPGETNKTISVNVKSDMSYESNETFYLNVLASPFSDVATCTILNDDPMPTLSINDVTLTEGNIGTTNAVFTVGLSNPSGFSVTAFYSTISSSALAGSDFMATTNGYLTIPPGITTTNIFIPIIGDVQIEPDEVFYVDLSSVANAILLKREGYCLIQNDDGLPGRLDRFVWNAMAPTQYVGQPFGVTITALDAFNNLATEFTNSVLISVGSAVAGTNIVGGGSIGVNYPTYTGYDDSRTQVIYPASELGGAGRFTALTLDVSVPSGLTLSNWTIRLKHASLSNYTTYAWESSNWTVVYQTNQVIGNTGLVTFAFSTPFDYDGSNNLMVDFSFNNSTFSSMGACRATLRNGVSTIYYYDHSSAGYGDPLTWTGTIPPASGSGYTPNLRLIRDPGFIPSIQPNSTAPFMNGTWNGNLSVLGPASTLNLRADDGAGHSGLSGVFSVELRDDISVLIEDSPDPLSIGGNVNYLITVTNIGPSAATDIIATNLLPASVTLVSATTSQGAIATNGNILVFNLGSLAANGSASLVIVAIVPMPGTITNLVTVSRAEADATPANNSAVATTLVQNPLLAITDVAVSEGNSGVTPAVFSVSLSFAPAIPVEVHFSTANGTALAGSDYIATNGVLNFTSGQTNQTITVQVLGDTNAEQNETFTVLLSNPTNAAFANPAGIGTIMNDEVLPYVYMRSTVGAPWNSMSNEMAMNRVFGVSMWQNVRYETVSPAALFTPAIQFIFMEGSDMNAIELQSFLFANLMTIQNWVSAGGRLFINAAPNEGSGMSLGFGVTLLYPDSTSTGNATDSQHTIFQGPFAPVGTNWTGMGSVFGRGTSFGHATVSGTGLVPHIINLSTSRIVLGELVYGNGRALFGGMTTDNLHTPQPHASNLRANILAYAASYMPCSNCPPSITSQPTGSTNTVGATVVLIAAVSGTSPFTYQWRMNGAPLSQNTNATMSLTNVQLSDAGQYVVVVTNSFGSATSSNASVAVVVAPPFFDDFEPSIDLIQWSGFGGVVGSTILATDYGGSVSGGNAIWFGANGSRFLVSRALNTIPGGTIRFYIRLASAGASGQWETVDLPGEGIVLEYSTNSVTWIEFGRYDTTTYTTWTLVNATIPPAARTAATLFRWRQLVNSGSCCDHWALDDVGALLLPQPPLVLSSLALNGDTLELALSGSVGQITADRLSKIQVFCATNISLALSNWTLLTNQIVLNHGVIQVNGVSFTNAPIQYFRAVELP